MDADAKKWHVEQVDEYVKRLASFKNLAAALKAILENARDRRAPGAIVQAREKTIASFAEKALRKRHKHEDPVNQLTDLAGARVVTYTQNQADAVCRFIEGEPGFEVDWDNSLGASSRLSIGEFGYRGVHYVVRLREPVILGVEITPGIGELKAEIQVSTMLQHFWSVVGHDRIYKSELQVPDGLERQLAGVASLLEIADREFEAVTQSLDTYIHDFDAYLRPDERQERIDKWKTVLRSVPKDEQAIRALGRLYIADGKWADAYEQFEKLQAHANSEDLGCLGLAAWRTGHVETGRTYLEEALELDPSSVDVLCNLGFSYLTDRPELALQYFSRALTLAPTEPRVLCPYVESLLRRRAESSETSETILSLLRSVGSALRSGIDECRRRARIRVYLPEAHFNRGRLHLYLGEFYESLEAYALAISMCPSPTAIRRELDAIREIVNSLEGGMGEQGSSLIGSAEFEGFEWVRRLLLLAVAIRTSDEQEKTDLSRELQKFASSPEQRECLARGAIVIVAGACSAEALEALRGKYQPLLVAAFRHFEGTVISGGTAAGICGIVADLEGPHQKSITKLGYLPGDRQVAPGYDARKTDGRGFSPLDPIAAWSDIHLAGRKPSDIRVLGCSGGELAAFEYQLGLALGAKVGVLQSSGSAASELVESEDWKAARGLVPMPDDAATVKAFVALGMDGLVELSEAQLEQMARTIHEEFRSANLENPAKVHPSILPWEPLPGLLKESNRSQATYAVFILRCVGFDVLQVGQEEDLSPPDGYDARIEEMAELEHGRYNAERLSDGWRCGRDNDPEKKTNPTLVAWEDVSFQIQEFDRRAVRAFPGLLAKVRLRIVDMSERG